ncbi:unnamed protein product [Gadus morhua 'NCC']
MSSELYMECEEEELEPWQREVMEDDEEEEMDVVCQVKQEEEFVNGPGPPGDPLVRDDRKAQEVVDLSDYERSEELRKSKSRSKKNHSKFTLLRCKSPGNTLPQNPPGAGSRTHGLQLHYMSSSSPEEKESWISAINGAITRAKNSILDEVTVEDDSQLSHLTRDRARIPQPRRLPTRGHLMSVEEDDPPRAPDPPGPGGPPPLQDRRRPLPPARRRAEASGKSQSLPRETGGGAYEAGDAQRSKRNAAPTRPARRSRGRSPRGSGKERCASMEQILGPAPRTPTAAADVPAKEVLEEVLELRALCRQLDSPKSLPPSPLAASPLAASPLAASPLPATDSAKRASHRKSMM